MNIDSIAKPNLILQQIYLKLMDWRLPSYWSKRAKHHGALLVDKTTNVLMIASAISATKDSQTGHQGHV
eukprot:55841-Eustigmatos_ZCMA.PRE.3